jgi:hypothetical protein
VGDRSSITTRWNMSTALTLRLGALAQRPKVALSRLDALAVAERLREVGGRPSPPRIDVVELRQVDQRIEARSALPPKPCGDGMLRGTERTSGVTRALVMELAPMRGRQLIAAPGSSSRSSRSACSAA